MKILIACEESQEITKAFREKGHESFSCDIKPCSGGRPEWHIQEDCVDAICSKRWDIIIFHPDCTFMAVSGNRWYGKGMPGYYKRVQAIEWTLTVWELIKEHSDRAALENPVSVIFSQPQTCRPQYIQPWQFGHGETKKTGFKLYNLPELKPMHIVSGREQRVWKMPPSENRKSLRSKTYPGIAKAIAEQWGELGRIPAPQATDCRTTAPRQNGNATE
jgi:hypothetical protein